MSYGQRPPAPAWGAPADPLRRQLEQTTERMVAAQPIARALVDARRDKMTTPTHGGRAVKRLVSLIEGFHQQLEAHTAAALASALQPKLDNAKAAVTRMAQTVGKQFDEAAQAADDYTAQISNGEGDDPTASEQSSGGSAKL